MRDTLQTLMRRLVESIGNRDVDRAVAQFTPDGRILIEDRLERTVSVRPRDGLAAVVTGFENVSYSSVLHQVLDDHSDDGVLSAIHTGTFLGCAASDRRVYLNVHLTVSEADGLLETLTVSTSVASLIHQLRGGGDTAAVADGLTAEVRYRTWTDTGAPEIIAPAPLAAAAPTPDAPATAAKGRTRPANRVVAVLAVLVLAALATGAVVIARLPKDDVAPTSTSATATSSPSATPLPYTAATTPVPSPSSSTPTTTVTTPPSIVTQTGAPQVQPGRQVVLPSDVLFGFDSAQLSPQTQSTLANLAQQIKDAHVTGQIQVNGYTDNLGSAAHGLDLSKQRALAVAQALQANLGDSPVTLLAQGFGDADPIADNSTEDGRNRNRRVTIVLPATSP